MASAEFNNMEEIDLLKLLKALWRKAWLIAICVILGAGIAFYWSYMTITTNYVSSGLMYVNNNSLSLGSAKLSISSGDIKTTNSLMETYSIILKSRNTLQDIIAETGLPYTYEELYDMIQSEPVEDTAIFKITVTAEDPEIAAHVANSILAVLPEKISTVVEGSSAQIVEYAVPGEPIMSGSMIKNAAIGALLGAVLSCSVVILMFMLDTKIRSEEFLLENYRDIPLLATIPDLSASSKGGYYGYRKAYSKKHGYRSYAYSQAARNSQTNISKISEGAKTDSKDDKGTRPGNREA